MKLSVLVFKCLGVYVPCVPMSYAEIGEATNLNTQIHKNINTSSLLANFLRRERGSHTT
jgi:hypothetical protein